MSKKKNEGHVGSENRRDYYRMVPGRSLCARMRIHTINGTLIDGHETRVCVENVSAGGMAFTTNLKLPLEVSYTLLIDVTLMGKSFRLESVVVRSDSEERYGLYTYGVTFVTDSQVRKSLLGVINRMDVLAKRTGEVYKSCSVCDQRIEKGCFRGLEESGK